MSTVNEALMEELYAEDKVLIEDIVWEQNKNNPTRYSMRASVITVEGDEMLTLCGQRWKKGYSFVLRYNNNVVRVWDFNDHHPGINGGHKHKYTENGFRDKDPYEVNDVTTSDVNQGLNDFLAECQIENPGYTIHEIPGLNDYA